MSDTKQPLRPEESLAKMIASLKGKTGNSLEEWKAIIAKSTWLKHGEIVAGLEKHPWADSRIRPSNRPSREKDR